MRASGIRRLLIVPLAMVAACGDTSSSGTTPATPPATPPATQRNDQRPNDSLAIPSTTEIVQPVDFGSTTTSLMPATTAVVRTTGGAGTLVLPEPVDVTEPCPDSYSGSFRDGSGMTAESSRLEPMLGVVLAHGNEHPDEFGTYGLLWHDEADASVFISFTTHLDEHRAALADMVEFPDELIVCQVALAGQATQALFASLQAELAGRSASILMGMGPLEVMLQPDDEALAAELVDRYGDAIDVTVGVLSYPIAEASPVCTEPVGERSPAGLEVAIVPPAGPFVTSDAEPWSFEIRLTNVGDAPIAFGSGIATGTVLDAIGNVVGSSANIGREDVGIQIDLAPGASTSLPGVVGPASCEPRLGYLLPPGDYQLVATLSRFDASSQGTLLTPPQPIVVAT